MTYKSYLLDSITSRYAYFKVREISTDLVPLISEKLLLIDPNDYSESNATLESSGHLRTIKNIDCFINISDIAYLGILNSFRQSGVLLTPYIEKSGVVKLNTDIWVITKLTSVENIVDGFYNIKMEIKKAKEV